jgi:hypothetical protein
MTELWEIKEERDSDRRLRQEVGRLEESEAQAWATADYWMEKAEKKGARKPLLWLLYGWVTGIGYMFFLRWFFG